MFESQKNNQITPPLYFNDADEQALFIQGWDQQYEQISMGKFSGRLQELWLGDIQFILEGCSQSVHQIGASWHDSRCFILPIQQEGVSFFRHQVVDIDTPMTLNPNEIMDYRTCSNNLTIGIAIPNQIMDALSCLEECENLNDFFCLHPHLHANTAQFNELKSLLIHLFSHATAHAELPSSVNEHFILDEIFCLLFSSFSIYENTLAKKIYSHKKIVNHVKELILEDPSIPPSMTEICKEVGVSQKVLQHCFHEIMGTSPAQYLKAVRLNRVRRDLKKADHRIESVQDIACKWGFWHASNFTSNYKTMFGELPSETLIH